MCANTNSYVSPHHFIQLKVYIYIYLNYLKSGDSAFWEANKKFQVISRDGHID